ncbi:MAG: AMP-binding protein [Deltaproteobacteria bacterium]|nr:AMP-binding protein [Deltaproteobacteria bacterium]MBI3390298.1 AMP-binding protein [Deltaproteobacteria bacterium]
MPTETLSARIFEHPQATTDATLLSWGDREYQRGELLQAARTVAGGLTGYGIQKGERVAVGLRNSPELIEAVLGVLYAGAVLVPLNPAYTADEAAYVVRDSGAALVYTHPEQAALLRAADGIEERRVQTRLPIGCDLPESAQSVAPDDPALLVYTSGTTAKPKGATLSHRALVSNLETVSRAWRWTAADRLLLTLPCFHLHGLALGILGSLLVGSQIVLRERFVAEGVPQDIERHRITLFFGVPTMYNRLVGLPEETLRAHDLSSMRVWVSGSAPLTAATFSRFEQRFGHQILERFGMSEGGFMIAAPYEGPRRAGVVGRPLPGIEVRIGDVDAADRGELCEVAEGEQGELLIRGPNLFSGYWKRPEETARAFVGEFFRSGDLAVREADGMIRITGRRSVDIVKTRGFKVSAVEIESHLQSHPGVCEVAVVGIPDADQGERVVAAVTRVADSAVSADELRQFARAGLAPHKVPSEIVFVDEIPRTGPGKFSKRLLIERLSRLPDA